MPEPEFKKYYLGLLQKEKESREKDLCQSERIIENRKIFEEYKKGSKEDLMKIMTIVGLETRKNVLEDLLNQQSEWPLQEFVPIYDMMLNRQNRSDWGHERQMLGDMRQLMINNVLKENQYSEKKLSHVIEVEKRSEVLDVLIRRLTHLQEKKDIPLSINWTKVINFVAGKESLMLPEFLVNKIQKLIDLADTKGAGIQKHRRTSFETDLMELIRDFEEKERARKEKLQEEQGTS